MARRTIKRSGLLVFFGISLLLVPASVSLADDSARSRVDDLLTQSEVRGGLVVHVGCDDGTLAMELATDDRFLVHGLGRDAKRIDGAREIALEASLNTRPMFDRLSGTKLPYADNLVNLAIVESGMAVAVEEVMRVLAPGGVAMTRHGDGWTRQVKPWPESIDQWTHFLHGPDGNAVANDRVVGPPRHMQWVAAPAWARFHHTLASVSSVVSTNGRLFAIIDEGPAASMQVPGRWVLTARDAFSGVLLWKRPISDWAYHRQRFRSGPVQLPRTLVAVGDRVFAPIGIDEPLSALDAATGETLRTYRETMSTEEVLFDDGVLFVVTGTPAPEQASVDPARKGEAPYPNDKRVVAIEADSGKVLWTWTDSVNARLMPLTLAVRGKSVYLQAGEAVHCLDRASGEPRWQADFASKKPTKPAGKNQKPKRNTNRSAGWSVATLVACDEVVLWADGRQLRSLDAADGSLRWECPCPPGFKSPSDVFVVDGLVWIGTDFAEGRDIRTGEVKQTNPATNEVWTVGHHHRCYRNKATERFIMTAKRGIEFFDLQGDDHTRNNWIRGVCQYGIMPCNGLIYAPPHACGCFMEAKLIGFWAVAPKQDPSLRAPVDDANRLTKGPVYTSKLTAHSSPLIAQGSYWPTLRGSATRSGATNARLSLPLNERWDLDTQSKASAPVVGGGRAIAVATDEHVVVSVNAENGEDLWCFTAGGRIDSPPTVHGNLVLFGCADGYVYCLRLNDGALAWKFLAARNEMKTVAFDQIESLWPVKGSVLVQNGIAYAAAGRSSYLDEGITLYGLDPATGEILSKAQVRSENPAQFDFSQAQDRSKQIVQNAVDAKTFQDPDKSDAFSMGGTTNDVLVGDGTSVYLRQMRFDANLNPQESMGRHLLSTSGLLDDAENHRSHWVLGTGDFSRTPVAYSWTANRPSGSHGYRLMVPYGLMLAFDDAAVWSVRRKYDGYQLVAQNNTPFSKSDESLPDFREADNKEKPVFNWSVDLPIRPRAMVKAGDLLIVAGVRDLTSLGTAADLEARFEAFEGHREGKLLVFSAQSGETLAEYDLPAAPIWDGLAIADGRLYLTTADGRLRCWDQDQ